MSAVYFHQITAGIEYANTHWSPDWKSKIDLDTLDMKDVLFCVVGQVLGNYNLLPVLTPTEELGFSIPESHLPDFWNEDFDPDGYRKTSTAAYARLTAEWKAALTGHPSFHP